MQCFSQSHNSRCLINDKLEQDCESVILVPFSITTNLLDYKPVQMLAKSVQ